MKHFIEQENAKLQRYVSHYDDELKFLMVEFVIMGEKKHINPQTGTYKIGQLLTYVCGEVARVIYEREDKDNSGSVKTHMLTPIEAYSAARDEWDVELMYSLGNDIFKLVDYLIPYTIKAACDRYDNPIYIDQARYHF